MTTLSKIISGLLLGASVAAAMPTAASAATPWQRSHPARTEINHRIASQERRITVERREGELTRGQAMALRSDDRSVLMQERADARADQNYGHLDRSQIRDLNGELNANSRAIGR